MEDTRADVIDISPLPCPACREPVEQDDAYCWSCGTNLLDDIHLLCGNCGKALAETAAFCSSCGTAVTDEVPLDVLEDDGAGVEKRPSRKKKIALIGGLVLLMGAAAIALWFFLLRGPDLASFDAGLKRAVAIAGDVQTETVEVQEPADLDSYAASISSAGDELGAIENQLGSIEDGDYSAALRDVVETEARYLDELERLAGLPSADAVPGEYLRIPELAKDVEAAVKRAIGLRGDDLRLEAVELSPTSLTSTLSRLAEYRQQVVQERARIQRLNKARAERLGALTGVTDQLDGILTRYSDARADLSTWIDGVNTHGVSFMEAYDVLAQHSDLRSQLRDELSALDVPEPFGIDKAAFLGVMDQAITATQDASRGVAEYELNWSYVAYDETPGWLSFESATDRISDDYEAALSAYEVRKDDTGTKLSKKTPLPKLPE